MAFKVLIGQKNSKWKVVQNPLKGNFYTDIVDFKSDADKEEFLNRNFFPDWKNLDNGSWVETPLKWHDEIHATFTIDLEKTNFKRSEALRKDFCCVYDSNEETYKFYTMEAHLDKQVYTTLTYVIELDLFFTYDIKNIWKENVKVLVERGVFKTQWNLLPTTMTPSISIDGPRSLDEEMGDGAIVVKEDTNLTDSDITGFLIFIKPKARKLLSEVSFNNSPTSPWNTTWADTLLIEAKLNGASVSTVHLLFENTGLKSQHIQYMRPKNEMYYTEYPPEQRIDGLKKQEKYFVIYIDNSELSNEIAGSISVADLFSSPDVLKVVPCYTVPDYKQLDSQVIYETNSGGYINLTYENTAGPFYIDFTRNNYNFKILKDGWTTTTNFEYPISLSADPLKQDTYTPEQYAKLYTGNNFYYKLINGQKQAINLQWEYLGNTTKFSVNRKRVFTFEGNFALTTINTGKYAIGGARTDYTLEETDAIRGYQNTSEWLNYVSNNLTSINQNLRIQSKAGLLGLVSGFTGLGVSAAGLKKNKPNNSGQFGEQMLEPSQRAMEAGYNLLQMGKDYQGASLVRTGLSGFNQGLQTQANANRPTGGLTGLAAGLSAITSLSALLTAHDAIKQEKANLQALQNRGGAVGATGSEYERLKALDNVWGLNVQTYSLPDSLKNKIGDFFHRYGYKVETLSSPTDWLSNGRYWDFFMAGFNSLYQAFNENLSPQESKIAALSLSQGVRIWHWSPDIYEGWEVGDYSKRNISR